MVITMTNWKEKITKIMKRIGENTAESFFYLNLPAFILFVWAILILFSSGMGYIISKDLSRLIAIMILIYLTSKEYEVNHD
jgi:hypothetical protein